MNAAQKPGPEGGPKTDDFGPVVTPRLLLRLASTLSPQAVGKLAHALGWPATSQRYWSEPYRNYYVGDSADLDWRDALAVGLAGHGGKSDSGTVWRVTELGKLVVRLVLDAYRKADPKKWKWNFAAAADAPRGQALPACEDCDSQMELFLRRPICPKCGIQVTIDCSGGPLGSGQRPWLIQKSGEGSNHGENQ